MRFITKKIYIWKAISPYKFKIGFDKFFGYYQYNETKSIGIYFGKWLFVITKIIGNSPFNNEPRQFKTRIRFAG